MTKKVLITVSGRQFSEENGEDVTEIQVPGEYHFKAGRHFLLYEEAIDGGSSSSAGNTAFTKNLVRFTEGYLEVDKKGAASAHMLFTDGQEFLTPYRTPYGEILMEFDTNRVRVSEKPSLITARAFYGLKMNGVHTADCELTITVQALDL